MSAAPIDRKVRGVLSPSRAGDFMSCPLLFRYRTIDRLPETSSPDAVRGTLVHQVLEDIFDLPSAERTPAAAHRMLEPAWRALQAASGQAREVATAIDEPTWLDSAHTVLDRWFTLEDPTRLEPAEREAFVDVTLPSGLQLRGIIDRLDRAPDGALRVVDYKGLALDTPLPTPGGWTTMGEVQVGDELFGADGHPTRVTAKSAIHDRQCYRLTFRDGSSVVSDNVHLWPVVHSRRQVQTRELMSTEDLAELHADLVSQGRRGSAWIQAADAISSPEVSLPIDPWVLGAWLGGGSSRGGELSVGKVDLPDTLALVKERWAGGVTVKRAKSAFRVTLTNDRQFCAYGHDDWKAATKGHPARRCCRERAHSTTTPSNGSLTSLLRSCGLTDNKHIPLTYLRASHDQRVELLRGLMDTDGWWNTVRHRAGYTTTDDRLAEDVIELLRTLGINPLHFRKPHENAKRPDRTWHVIEFTPGDVNPFALPRKAIPASDGVTPLQRTLATRRVLASVELVESEPTQCITVDAPRSLYLCGRGFLPTHNSGNSPAEGFEARALFQLRIYALIIWRSRGVVPSVLQLVYLGNGQIVRYEPDEADLLATERKVDAVWEAIEVAKTTGDFQPRRGKPCDWCAFKAHCPAWGGELLPMPAPPTRWAELKRSVRRRWRRLRRRLRHR